MPDDLRARAATFGLTLEEFDDVVRKVGRQSSGREPAVLGALGREPGA